MTLWKILYDFGGGGGGGLSEDAQRRLMQEEQENDRIRRLEERAYQEEQEEARLAREDAQRLLQQQEESQRIRELEAQEQEGIDVAMDMLDSTADADTGTADMFASLAFGTGAASTEQEAEEAPEARPE
tara:strand:- start:430 stop:816 length:387 start_codon:yes stop_codon:yes gene_type:complete